MISRQKLKVFILPLMHGVGRSSEYQSWTSATGSSGAEWGIVLKWGKRSLIQHLWAPEEISLLSLIGFGSAWRILLELSFCAYTHVHLVFRHSGPSTKPPGKSQLRALLFRSLQLEGCCFVRKLKSEILKATQHLHHIFTSFQITVILSLF